MSLIIQSPSFNKSPSYKKDDQDGEVLNLKFKKFKNYINSLNTASTDEILNNYELDVPVICILFHIKIDKKDNVEEIFSKLRTFIDECRKKRKMNSFLMVYFDIKSKSHLELYPLFIARLFKVACSLVTNNFSDVIQALSIIDQTSVDKSGELSCPICTHSGFAKNLSVDDLREHIYLFHCNESLDSIENKIPICPICFKRPQEKIGVHLHEHHGPKGEKTEHELALSKIYPFCLVIVRKKSNGTFLIVNESAGRGYWLPGGRLNTNESLQQCAIRECKEETGIDIELKGILRVEYSPFQQYSRMRVIFYAEPKDENQPPRQVPNYESMGGLWVSTKDLSSLDLRGKEPTIWFNYVEKGKDIYPLSLLTLENAIPR
ncbi:hypothetical protein DICPUDRAFT_78326 [Dictyostelium purpureum]|uniref:Nudix hydrolase domain-containing protein n=1 Tax=Dictyostelium purpureum TaxID=5786 RepID=F0ZJ80_DICPU|nr:uncharacterized protein DICPUDRAFT_78326 [Dictyostelium purpureum]EGC35973.1 hypothetical protein DICPUDRAFT_78326 [Dictyostelium purpureum]|eukprot:XP_003287474.1 hypothetical protein DICPUDRAFT_78326 [Dictyostelium purpureum]